jgi:hypothetical protein
MSKLLQILTMSGFIFAMNCFSAEAINIQIRDGVPVVDSVYVNGHGPYRFLVDTGATLNHIDLKLAKSIGLSETIHTELTTSVGVIPVSGGTGIEVVLGPARQDRQTFLFAGIDTVQKRWPDVQGMLGQEFLSHFDYFMDMRGKELQFGQHESGGKVVRASYQIDHGRPVISTSLGSLVLDSAALGLIRFGLTPDQITSELRTMSGTKQVGTVFSTLTIEGCSFWRGGATALPKSAEAGVDGLLPVGLFKSVYVSSSEGYVVFEK